MANLEGDNPDLEKKGTIPSNYRPMTCLSMMWENPNGTD